MNPLPLAPYTVVDLTRARSGPTCVRQLADMGARVIKVQARTDIDGDAPRHGFDFQNLHCNKHSMTLDLKDPRGREILERLAARADVLVENFRPDVKHRLGIDYEHLSAVNPRLIYASIAPPPPSWASTPTRSSASWVTHPPTSSPCGATPSSSPCAVS